jgi:CheY-like chemotaxis protein
MIRPPTSPVVGGAAGGGSKGPPDAARHPASGGRVQRSSVVDQAGRANGTRRVVVADDRDESREGMAYWLRQAGFDVVEASDTTELLEHIANRPDVVVLDAQLPGRGSFEIANRLKSDPATATIPIIHVASGFTTGEWRAQGSKRAQTPSSRTRSSRRS